MKKINNYSTIDSTVFKGHENIDNHIKTNMTDIEMNKFIEDYDLKLVIENENQNIIVIDNDECIGSWGDLSLLYSMLKMDLVVPDIDIFVKIMSETNCVRPYVKELFEKIIDLRNKNIIFKIFMCTAASNKTGWVTFLSKVLERWIGHKIYDEIIYGEMIEQWHIFNNTNISNNIGYIKNMNMVREIIDFKYNQKNKNYTIIAIDDRPSNIINGIPIGVTPYHVAINIFQVLKLFFPKKFEYLMAKHDKLINDSWERYMKNPCKYSKIYLDRDIFEGINIIDKLFYPF